MPKNTYLLKENFSKIEEVREIENYVPTYEEFISKKSQLSLAARKKIINKSGSNYQSPLIDKDISEAKGYGPCYVCQKPEQWTDLKIRCGGENCSETTSNYWHHNWCGGKFKVSNRAYAKCSNCGTSCHLSKSNFSCSKHSGSYEEARDYNYKFFRRAPSLTLMEEGCSEVLVDLAVYIVNHKHEWGI
jgi:hypothetical protein